MIRTTGVYAALSERVFSVSISWRAVDTNFIRISVNSRTSLRARYRAKTRRGYMGFFSVYNGIIKLGGVTKNTSFSGILVIIPQHEQNGCSFFRTSG